MANLKTNFVGISSPNPFWLASAPPTDKAYNVNRAFEAGWGGVVWKTLGEAGPPIVNVNGPRYGALLTPDRRLIGFNNIELITDRELDLNLREITEVKRAWPDRAVVVSLMVPCHEDAWKSILPMRTRHRLRRHRAELRLPAWHERTRHGLGGGPGAGVHPDGDEPGANATAGCR
jgi:dihydropyrimidine dehydrogenase (NAD+) subunit PreA